MKTKTLLTMITIFCTINLFGQIIHVPNDYLSIQAGINAAGDGDTVLVADGSYLENINFKGKAITVASHYLIDGDQSHVQNTIIDGSQPNDQDSAAVVMFVSGEDTTSVIYGFTITSGAGITDYTTGMRVGGGISLYLSGAKIIKNTIVGNSVSIPEIDLDYGIGGGIGSISDAGNHWLVVEDNEIIENTVNTSDIYNQTAIGGGIYTSSNARIINNKIQNNECFGTSFSLGAGTYFESNVDDFVRTIYFTGNKLQYNDATGDEWVFGGGMYLSNCELFLEDNMINYNTVHAQHRGIGGGITLNQYSYPVETFIINNEFIGNECSGNEDAWASAINISHPMAKVEMVGNVFSSNVITAGRYGYGTVAFWVFTNESYWYVPNIIEGNMFTGNRAEMGGALVIFNSFNTSITNNLFAGNESTEFSGGAIYFQKGEPDPASSREVNSNTNSVIANNTFVYNQSAEYGGAIRSNYDSDELLTFNNLFWGNTADDDGDDIYYYGEGQGMFIAYSHIDESKISGSWNGWGNVFANPKMQNDSLHLSGGSSCFNTGADSIEFNYTTFHCPQADIEGDARPMYGGVDIGADEYFVVGVEPVFAETEQIIEVYPNPFSLSTTIKFRIKEPSRCVLKVYNSFGNEVETVFDRHFEKGDYKYQWNNNDLPNGIYHLRLQVNNKVFSAKALHLK